MTEKQDKKKQEDGEKLTEKQIEELILNMTKEKAEKFPGDILKLWNDMYFYSLWIEGYSTRQIAKMSADFPQYVTIAKRIKEAKQSFNVLFPLMLFRIFIPSRDMLLSDDVAKNENKIPKILIKWLEFVYKTKEKYGEDI